MGSQCKIPYEICDVQDDQRIACGEFQFQITVFVMMVFLYGYAFAETTIPKKVKVSQILTETDNGKIVESHIGSEVVLRLTENAATGYRWGVEAIDESLVEVQEGEYLPLSHAIGSGGEAQWIVRAKATGITTIKLKHWRRWEGEISVRERFEFSLRIVP